jgi:hypothetical protein
MATSCFRVTVAESESLADLKLRGFFTDIIQGAGRRCLLSFRSGSESPRVVIEHVLPSVVWAEAAKATMGCRPLRDEVFYELISLTGLLFLIAVWLSSLGGSGKSCRSCLARGANHCVVMELVLPSAADRGSGSNLRTESQQRIGKPCLCPHLFPLHYGIRGWGSADTPPERLGFWGCLNFLSLGARCSCEG